VPFKGRVYFRNVNCNVQDLCPYKLVKTTTNAMTHTMHYACSETVFSQSVSALVAELGLLQGTVNFSLWKKTVQEAMTSTSVSATCRMFYGIIMQQIGPETANERVPSYER